MQQLLKSMKVDQRETSFHLELHFTSVGFGIWFSIQDSQQDMVRKLHEMAALIESDMQMRSAQLPLEPTKSILKACDCKNPYPEIDRFGITYCEKCGGRLSS